MVKYKFLNVETKAGMQKRVGWEMETVGLKVGGLALYDGLFLILFFLSNPRLFSGKCSLAPLALAPSLIQVL